MRMSLLSNTSGITYLEDYAFCTLTISHFNGFLLRTGSWWSLSSEIIIYQRELSNTDALSQCKVTTCSSCGSYRCIPSWRRGSIRSLLWASVPILSCICTSISCLNFKHAITGASSLVHLTFPVLIMQLVAADEGISKPSSFYKHLASVAGQRSVFGTLLVPTMLFPPHTPVLPPLPPTFHPSSPSPQVYGQQFVNYCGLSNMEAAKKTIWSYL